MYSFLIYETVSHNFENRSIEGKQFLAGFILEITMGDNMQLTIQVYIKTSSKIFTELGTTGASQTSIDSIYTNPTKRHQEFMDKIQVNQRSKNLCVKSI